MPPSTSPPRLEAIRQESFEILSEAVAERAQHLVRNVVLLGPQSRNGYRYSAAAMQAALPLYENRPIFLDHADEQNSPTRRKLRDFAGQVLSPRYEGERLRGDLRLLGPHTDWLFDLIEAAPQDIGMSHVVLGRRSTQGQIVEHIERVVSVDIVAFPATTHSFHEGTDHHWVPQLLVNSSLPESLRTEAVRSALAIHPEPSELLHILEGWAGLLERESPQSAAKLLTPEVGLPAGVRQSLVRAIRGR
jgi:hypothetical protein